MPPNPLTPAIFTPALCQALVTATFRIPAAHLFAILADHESMPTGFPIIKRMTTDHSRSITPRHL